MPILCFLFNEDNDFLSTLLMHLKFYTYFYKDVGKLNDNSTTNEIISFIIFSFVHKYIFIFMFKLMYYN